MSGRVNVGLIGCGKIMPKHLNGYRILINKGINARIVALCSRNIKNAERFRGFVKKSHVDKNSELSKEAISQIRVYDFQTDIDVELYDDYKVMLRKADIDAVEIFTPHSTHHSIALDSFEAGKHVLVEKPLAITVKAGLKMIEAAEKTSLILGVSECLRYGLRGTREIKWIIEQGYIGDVRMVFIGDDLGGRRSPNKMLDDTPWRHQKLKAGAGVALDIGVHFFDTLRYLCGEIKEVTSILKTFEETRVIVNENGTIQDKVKNEVDDSFFTLVNFVNGAVGNLYFSMAVHGEKFSLPGDQGNLAIYGSKGCVKGDRIILDDGTDTKIRKFFEEFATKEAKVKFFPMGIRDPFALETLDFLDAIREGKELEVSGREGLKDMILSYAMVESSNLNQPVRPEDIESGRISNYEKEINKYFQI
jgi:predicted dehydrogenase